VSKIARSALLLNMLAIAFFGAPSSAQAEAPRLNTIVLDYVAPLNVAGPNILMKSLIDDGVRYIRGKLAESHIDTGEFDYLRLGVVILDSQGIASDIWESEHALQVLSGRIALRADDPNKLTVTSDVYVGGLAAKDGQGSLNELRLQTEFSYDRYETVADVHHLVMLHALLMDATSTGKPTEVTSAIAQAACFVAQDLKASSSLRGDLKRLVSHLQSVSLSCSL